MATLSRIKPGQILWSVTRGNMGNTTVRTSHLYEVRVIDVHDDFAIVSWNGNPPQRYYSGHIAKLRTKKPVMITSAIGRQRVARRGEVKAEGK
jgi:hypothetical protein